MAADNGERTEADGKLLGQHSSHGKAQADVEGGHCCPSTHHQCVMGMSKFNKLINAVQLKLHHSLHVPLNLTGIVPSKVNNSFCSPSLYAVMKNRLYSVPLLSKQP